MPTAPLFTVSRFENRNGVTSWRVAGCIAGVRIRKNFPSREDAAAETEENDGRFDATPAR
jgi:hypothetical protein